jgi:hypothetical protein
MIRFNIENQELKLDLLLSKIENTKDDELKAHLSKYFCVKISGFLENVIKNLIAIYVEKGSPKPVSNFVLQDIKGVTNLSGEKLSKFLAKFSTDWEDKFKDKITDKQIASLNSIISNRNSIAHGQQDNISYNAVSEYYLDLKEVVITLVEIIKK